MANSFEIRFSGGDVHPSTVPAHELADLLNAAEQAVTSLAAQNFPDLDPSSVLVGLVGRMHKSLAFGGLGKLCPLQFIRSSLEVSFQIFDGGYPS